MQPRLTFLLLMLVVLPLALMGWIAALLWRSEQEREALAWRNDIAQRVQVQQQSLESSVRAVAAQLSGLLTNAKPTADALAELTATQPMIRHAFVTDSQGKLRVPHPGKPETLSTQDREFLQRTEAIWSIGRPLGEMAVAENKASSTPAAPRGWHVWYYGDGPQWLYWQRGADGATLGVEVERAAFLAALLAGLKDESLPGCMRLVSSDGQVMQQHGSVDAQPDSSPMLTVPCAAPLQHWHWEYHAGPLDRPRGIAWPYILGFLGAAALFAAIGSMVFMTYRRNMRLAAQRVSFVNQVSHELKTPLTNIRLYTELARDSAEAQRTRYLDVVEEESGRLGRLIHNVLTFARQERQSLEVAAARGNLAALVTRVVESWRVPLQRKGIECVITSELTNDAVFDPDAAEQILGNLLSNIEKYATGATAATISLSAAEGFAEVRVCDDGPGIPDKALTRVFEAFYRARRDVTEGVSGTGLGLSIARALADAQHGSLQCVAASKGACFILRLPLASPSSSP